ncbi:26308_t:CDS:2, partial [Gigaspora margarita]
VEKYGNKQEFNIRCYHVERSNGAIRRRTLVCEHYSQPEATKSKDPKKVTTSKHVGFESYNSKIKRLILELAERLSLCILEEDKRTEYALFCVLIPKAVL